MVASSLPEALRADSADDSESARRFLHEARLAARLQHPRVVPLLTFGEVGGHRYYVMPYTRGETLADRIRRGPLGESDAPREFPALLDAVAELAGQLRSAGCQLDDLAPFLDDARAADAQWAREGEELSADADPAEAARRLRVQARRDRLREGCARAARSSGDSCAACVPTTHAVRSPMTLPAGSGHWWRTCSACATARTRPTPRAVARQPERERPILLGDPDTVMHVKPRVRPLEHRLGLTGDRR